MSRRARVDGVELGAALLVEAFGFGGEVGDALDADVACVSGVAFVKATVQVGEAATDVGDGLAGRAGRVDDGVEAGDLGVGVVPEEGFERGALLGGGFGVGLEVVGLVRHRVCQDRWSILA